MQLSSDVRIPDGLLAANALLSEKPHQGVPSWNLALHQGIDERNSTAAIGLRVGQHLGGVWSRYTGKERDTESGNDDFGARYYNSATGRWLSPDWSAQIEPVPYAHLGNPQSLNLYAYVLNNPLVNIDVDGHDCSVEGVGASCSALNEGAVADPSAEEQQADQMIGAAQSAGASKSSNQDKRDALAKAARGKYKSKEWNPKNGLSQCNIFVCAMIDAVGLNGPRNDNGHPISAAQWASSASIDNWRVLGAGEAPEPGDVAAVAEPGAFTNASGHAGIVSEVVSGTVYIIAAGDHSVYNTKASDFVPGYNVTYRRYTGN